MIQEMNESPSEKADGPAAERCVIAGEYWETRPGLLLGRLGAVLADIADEQLGAIGLSARDYSILAILAVDGPDSQFELAGLLGKAPGIIVAAIDRLQRHGLVKRTRDPEDRRRSIVTLTTAGQRKLARADALAAKTVAEILPGLDHAELEQLRTLLVKGLH
jgi:DNA-binding MarR family transcriptional regulator